MSLTTWREIRNGKSELFLYVADPIMTLEHERKKVIMEGGGQCMPPKKEAAGIK